MKCLHCPRAGSPCRGEQIPRLCELVDPTHPDHAPAYLAALEPPADYPPLATQARNLAGSLRDWLRAGAPITPRAERERRRAACRGCDRYDAEAGRCRACGCFGSLKPWLGTAACPLGRWDPSENASKDD